MLAWSERRAAGEHGHFALWLPVCLGTGILGYFSLHSEPAAWLRIAAALPAVVAGVLLRHTCVPQAAALAFAATAVGFAAAQFAATRAPPRADLPRHATIASGIVRAVELLPGGRRITLERAQLNGASPLPRWLRVHITAGDTGQVDAGNTVSVRALLRPPAPPAYPGAWNLQRGAWFTGQAAPATPSAPSLAWSKRHSAR